MFQGTILTPPGIWSFWAYLSRDRWAYFVFIILIICNRPLEHTFWSISGTYILEHTIWSKPFGTYLLVHTWSIPSWACLEHTFSHLPGGTINLIHHQGSCGAYLHTLFMIYHQPITWSISLIPKYAGHIGTNYVEHNMYEREPWAYHQWLEHIKWLGWSISSNGCWQHTVSQLKGDISPPIRS